MRCPFCGAVEDRVVDSRESRDSGTVRRRRECLGCNRRYTTYEKVEEVGFKVVKMDGTRQDFDRAKLLKGLEKACEKRPVSPRQLEEIADAAENLLAEREDREISTRELGEFLMERLRVLDQVAYVRFASVYRRFEDVEEFMAELKGLLAKDRERKKKKNKK
ncbi:MAG: transcriptional repressor NrdR [Thermoanaerobaculia bacterium]|nr:MAG: transcriptional repressor NrdR [Thermoanaerobaculia bacterium]